MLSTTPNKEIESPGSLLAFYDRQTGTFQYHPDLLDYLGSGLDGTLMWEHLEKTGVMHPDDAKKMQQLCGELDDDHCLYTQQCWLLRHGLHAFIYVYHNGMLSIAVKSLMVEISQTESSRSDALTYLPSRTTYCDEAARLLADAPDRKYAIFFFDVIKFKAINDLFGFAEGDRFLIHVADTLRTFSPCVLKACRTNADRFTFLADVTDQPADELVQQLLDALEEYDLDFDIHCNIGIYPVTDPAENVSHMLEKAMLAHASVKGSYARKAAYYSDQLRSDMLSEQEIIGSMASALEENCFLVYYQPQYNHSTGMIVGAEALVRWLHPEKGLISPGLFIPIFEKTGFITKIDYYVFEQACLFLRHCIDLNLAVVPISINFSIDDIYSRDFVENLEQIRQKHDVPSRLLRVEVTERVLINNNNSANEVFKKLHDCGYVIELDDFGSGYSSLNVLKDLDVDIIKLDMMFLAEQSSNSRGGTILSSVINMAKWLRMPVIAEGVETTEQADFLRSIGCSYVQGYLYSRPLPQQEYEKLLSGSSIGHMLPAMDLIDSMNAANFWDPKSLETLIFNNFVGGAAILRYDRAAQSVETLRVNQKYLQELGMNLSEHDIIHECNDEFVTDADQALYLKTLEKAIATGEEQECETWQRLHSSCCGDETVCIRSTLRMIGSSDDQFLLYKMIRNITAEMQHYQNMMDTERRFKVASEQVNIYFWEYTIATREMRPCFRCMRDLGLPALLRNYPDSAIEAGIFPPEVADMYRDWHVQIANGVKELSAVIPLTPDRVPFHVRYTTEFDENNRPIKAYGSAALVVS